MGGYEFSSDFKAKVVIVTGGARGIGKEIAFSFGRAGAKVAICDLSQEQLDQAVTELRSEGIEAMYVVGNVCIAEDVENIVDKVVDKWGRVDILINNAGITRDSLLLRMKEEDWDAVLNVNLKGVFLMTRSVSKVMVKQRAGKIINIASVVGVMGNVGQANYSASKGGVIAFTKTVARELASRGICVNAVAPGFIKTKMTEVLSEEVKKRLTQAIPLRRLGEPKDVANACLFLASSLADYITGHTILVDGGMVMGG